MVVGVGVGVAAADVVAGEDGEGSAAEARSTELVNRTAAGSCCSVVADDGSKWIVGGEKRSAPIVNAVVTATFPV